MSDSLVRGSWFIDTLGCPGVVVGGGIGAGPANPRSPERSRVSVLSPVGRALLGARAGDVLRVLVPGHGEREFALVELSYQPEANGRFDL